MLRSGELQRRVLLLYLMDRRVSGSEPEVSSPPEVEVELLRSILQAGNRRR